MAGVGTRDELIRTIGSGEQVELQLGEGVAADSPAVATAHAGHSSLTREGAIAIPVADAAALQDILARCSAHGIPLKSVTLRKPNLETVFLALTGRALRD
jgi:ABC-2 type transport system ATP-binding protein